VALAVPAAPLARPSLSATMTGLPVALTPECNLNLKLHVQVYVLLRSESDLESIYGYFASDSAGSR